MIAAILLSGSAAASPMTFCVEIPTNYINLVEQADFYTSNTDMAVRGVKIRVISNASFDETKFAEWSGPDAGCATFDLDDVTDNHVVLAEAESRVDGRMLRGRQVSGVNTYFTPIAFLTTSWSAPGGIYINKKTYQVPSDGPWHALTMGANVFARFDYNVSTSFMFNLAAGGPSESVPDVKWNDTTQHIYAHQADAFRTARNLGYAIIIARDEGEVPLVGLAPNDGCYGSGTDSLAMYGLDAVQKRYTSAAAVEGFADFVAVQTFNDRSTPKCVYRSTSHIDFDQDNVLDTLNSDMHYSCEALPMDLNSDGDTNDPGEKALDPNIIEGDWLEAAVSHLPGCNTPLTNRTTKHDWLRFYWDVAQLGTFGSGAGNVHPDDVASIVDTANPKNWWYQGGTPNNLNMPGMRIRTACNTLGHGPACNNQLFNGISHGTGWP